MPKYKFTYFNLKGRAEVIRFIFVVAGVPYEDVRITREEWSAIKHNKTFPFQKIPVLEIDDSITLAESHAIARYLATEFGLAGKTNLEKAKVDMAVDAIDDVFPPLKEYFFAPEEDKPRIFEEMFKTKLCKGMDNLERLLMSNNGGDGFFVGDSITWADLKFFCRLGDYIRELNPGFLKKYPKLAGHVDRILAIPTVKDWVTRRPVSAV